MHETNAQCDPAEQIFATGKIDLIEAQHAHAIIDIQPQGSSEHYQSTILAVDPAARTIAIDEVFPSSFSAAHGAALNVTLRLTHNRRVKFSTRLLRARVCGARYELIMPPDFTYSQRRNCYRFKLGHLATSAEFRNAHNYYCSADVFDISLAGIRLYLHQHIDFKVGDTLKQLSFMLNGQEFICDAIARNLSQDSEGRPIIGAELKNMSRLQQRALEKILAQFHRNLARQKADNKVVTIQTTH
jgi:c-di-GMP-binding flagellar brake protein YcgR